MSNCGLTNNVCEYIRDLLTVNESLQALILDNNSIDDKGGEFILSAVNANKSLRLLSMRNWQLST